MSLKSCTNKETNRYILEISVDKETFADATQKAFQRNVKKINIAGFRKGKAPRAMVEKLYGKDVFYEDALNIVYPDAAEASIKESGLTLVGGNKDIDFELVSMDENGVEFKITVTTKPEVTISNYKGLSAEKETVSVGDDEIEAEINRLADRNSRLVVVERAAKDGDTAVIDFEGFVDDVAFDGGKGSGYSLVIGSGQFIPGFEEQIIGKKAGEEFDVNVTFPEEYGAENLAGKPAVFKCTLHDIKEKELPAIDDEFAKDVSEFDTLEAFKEDFKTKTQERKQLAADNKFENDIIDQLVDLIEAEIPECMYNERIDDNMRDMEYRMKSQGMDMNTYLQYTGSTLEAMRDTMVEPAKRQVKVRLALEKIAELEGLKAAEEEVTAELARYAEDFKVDVERVKQAFPVSEIEIDLGVKKAIEFVKENAVIKKAAAKKPAADKPAAAKKPAAKKAAPKKKAEDK